MGIILPALSYRHNSRCLYWQKMANVRKKKHGGARKGAGRKPGITFKEPTVVMRIPISKVEAVKKLLKK